MFGPNIHEFVFYAIYCTSCSEHFWAHAQHEFKIFTRMLNNHIRLKQWGGWAGTHPQQAGPKIPSRLNVCKKVTIASLSALCSTTLRLAEFSFKHSKADSPTRRVGESFFDYEYLCEFKAKIGTAWSLKTEKIRINNMYTLYIFLQYGIYFQHELAYTLHYI